MSQAVLALTGERRDDAATTRVVAPETIREGIRQVNGWHQNTPLILVFSRQKKAPDQQVEGGAQAVRAVYDRLFCLDHVGIADEARSHYLHLCHGKAEEFPYAIRKPTANYGKTHQRIIKDTFGQQFLRRVSEGKYTLVADFAAKVKAYLEVTSTIDLRPLVLYTYWNDLGSSSKIRDLWGRFCEEFGVDRAPYAEVFTCSGLEEDIPTVAASDFPVTRMKQFVLPDEYGVGAFNVDFWRRFRSILARRLRTLKWQGAVDSLTMDITMALMYDQALFLLGAPGTGKTTIVLEAIIPSLREACGSAQDIRFAYHCLTPHSNVSELFGFQGLSGEWIAGPLVDDLLMPYNAQDGGATENGGETNLQADAAGSQPEASAVESELAVPRVLFLDEANRVDIEGILSPVQAAFDRLQKRLEPPVISLGRSKYIVPRRIWRIFAGNSPAADSGRREQSRPFKRRLATVIPPDPLESALGTDAAFRRLCFDLLEKAGASDDPEVAGPSSTLLGQYTQNPSRLEDLRALLIEIRSMRRVAVTVGLVESIVLRAGCQLALGQEGALDAAVCTSLGSLIAGDRGQVERLIQISEERRFPEFKKLIQSVILAEQPAMAIELDPIL